MPYIQKTIRAGKFLEVEEYPIGSDGRRLPRKNKEKPSSKTQAQLNEKNAKKKLARLLSCNFGENDFFMTLTYHDKSTVTEDEAKKELVNFLRRLRNLYKKKELPELKYIAITELDKKDGLHHHLALSGGVSRDEVESVWKKGRTRTSYIEEDRIRGLANYFTKQSQDKTPGKRRWLQSKNLTQPEVTKKVIKNVNPKKEPKPPKGYLLVDTVTQVNDYNGAVYRYSIFKKMDKNSQKMQC